MVSPFDCPPTTVPSSLSPTLLPASMVNLCWSLQCKKKKSCMDRMSMLPDELLGNILSHLTLKEAIASSILSRRWRYLWADLGRLGFDGRRLEGEERANYVKWVNDVIRLRKESGVVEFKVWMYLSKAEEGVMHEWVRYGLERKAQTLELNLSSGRLSYGECCSFPYRLLQCSSIHFKQLRRISLEAVNVSGEALEFFLCNCPLLETLCVSQSRELVTLRVVGPLPSLKVLEIRRCMRLKYVKIRDVNLVCLKYSGAGRVKFDVENAPVLVELYVAAWIRFLQCRFLKQFSGILGRLEMLNIEMRSLEDCWRGPLELSNLKQLVVTFLPSIPCRVRCMLPVTRMIEAAPRLEKFVLKARVSGRCGEEKKRKRKWNDVFKELKEIEFVGYGGVACELQLVSHLLERSPALQKITIHPRKLPIQAHHQLEALLTYPIILDIL